MSARFLVSDVFDGLATLADGSVDLVVTSPPFLALRSYLPADHPDKGKEIGSESTPAEFIDVLLRVTQELRRVLAPHGSMCVELGDTYAGSGGGGGDYLENGWREGQQQFAGSGASMRESNAAHWRQKNQDKDAWPLPKSKSLIAELYRIALAYGRNPLRAPLSARELVEWFETIVEDMRAGGFEPPATDLLRMMTDYIDQRSEFGPYQEYERWRVRNVVTWARPNPPVGALGDKWRPATSDLVIACTSDKRYWDDLATRRPGEHNPNGNADHTPIPGKTTPKTIRTTSLSGAPLLDYWEIPPGGYSGSHYAVFPPALVEPCVKAMGPQRVCRICGEPSRPIVETEPHRLRPHLDGSQGGVHSGEANQGDTRFGTTIHDLGWTDCGHDDYRPGLVLDPFAGSGTTLLVATGHGLDAIGIDLDERNAELALERVGGLLLEVE